MSKLKNAESRGRINLIPLCITTRSIGFGSAHIFKFIYSQFPAYKIPDDGDIYQLYRVGLALIQDKIQRASHAEGFRCGELLQQNIEFADSFYMVPYTISDPVNSVGRLRMNNTMYVPTVAPDNEIDGEFIPQSEHVFLFNLRKTVEALANHNTNSDIRRNFYENNPIPGTIWQGVPEDPVLQNPDDIIPPNYNIYSDLKRDYTEQSLKMLFLERKYPKSIGTIKCDIHGAKGMLVCNDQNGMRVSDRNSGESLSDYYKRLSIEGDLDDFETLSEINKADQLSGMLTLHGERPIQLEHRYPAYATRVCNQYFLGSYVEVCMTLFQRLK